MQQYWITVVVEEHAAASKLLYQSPELNKDSKEEKVLDFGYFLRLTNTK